MSCKSTPRYDCYDNPLGPSLVEACPAQDVFVFMSLINALFRKNNKISGLYERVVPVETPNYEYDFIVVGGGAAGCAVTARLTEMENWNVLLLEAGPDEPVGAQSPAFVGQFLGTEIGWDYATTNEQYACQSTGGSCAWPQGKNLGGCTSHNAMIYLRGHPNDYDNWANLGNEGWDWQTVGRYFRKGENNGDIDIVGRRHHGTGGPLPVETFPYLVDSAYWFLNASVEAGYGISKDLNGDVKSGMADIQGMQKDGVRYSSSRSYLWPNRDRPNLHVSLLSQVTKLIIENGRAIGVEYVKNGQTKRVYATKEVILSAGVIESPHLLLLSGIGPRDDLESFGIEVVRDVVGVGKNLHDHPGVSIPFTVDEPDYYDINWVDALIYNENQTGRMSNFGLDSLVWMWPSESATLDYPDLEIYFDGYFANCASGEVGALQSTGLRRVNVAPTLVLPKSRGILTLASADPFEHPLMTANYLAEQEDVDRMVEAVKISVALMLETQALSQHNFTLVDRPLEACADLEFMSDEYWTCVIRQTNYALYHQGGTCKMGPSSDPMAVVDPRLRVYGIEGLRVVDNSIMPQIPTSNTAAPAMMIGERAGDLIKEDWLGTYDEESCYCTS